MADASCCVLFILIMLNTQNGFGLNRNKMLTRLDEIELNLLVERIERRKSMGNMANAIENLEGRLNNSLSEIAYHYSESNIMPSEKHKEEEKEPISEKRFKEISDTLTVLKKGLQAEKKRSLKFRRRVSEDVISYLRNNSEKMSSDVVSVVDALKEIHIRLHDVENIQLKLLTDISDIPKLNERVINATEYLMQHHSEVLNALKNLTENFSAVLQTTVAHKDQQSETTVPPTDEPIKVPRPKSCLEVLNQGHNKSGVYDVYPGEASVQVYCDQETDGGGWTMFQRRKYGSVDFNRTWKEYKNGFGNLEGEYWLGNDNLHSLLSAKSHYELRVDLENFDNERAFAKYGTFKVGPETDKYVLTLNGYTGNAGDSLSYHNGRRFSTKDNDNDRHPESCSLMYKGGWWYDACYRSNLNGIYTTRKSSSNSIYVRWQKWNGYNPLKGSEMKFREHFSK